MQRFLTGLRWSAGTAAILAGTVGLIAACNQHPVSYSAAAGAVEFIQTTSVDGSTKLDMLWVVDNSGSMCQEQRILRDNFDQFISQLEGTNLDFHIGVTTTDMNDEYPLEPVARPGHLQSTPQPVPGFDRSCHTAVDAAGNAIAGDYSPIRGTIQAAVDCMSSPDDSYLSVSDAEIECGLYNMPQGCTISRAGCGGGGDPCTPEDLFPPPESYRSIPKVLKSADYLDAATLDIDRLKADFACMSLVGTRGYGIEKGLSAAVRATDPELTGGAVGSDTADTNAPNHGLIRTNSRFAVVFVTDENDCSHDGTLAENSACGGDVCEFANKAGADSPLIDPAVLKDKMIENLQATKGDDFGLADILVASIHGNSDRFSGEVPTDAQCGEPDYEGIRHTCASALGIAFSGDRYERFLREFPPGQFFPDPSETNPDAPLTGWMCNGDFRPALVAIGEFFVGPTGGCITRPIMPCDTSDECPPFPYTGQAGTCTDRPNADDSRYCDSGVQVRAVATNSEAFANLEGSGYCVEESIGAQGLASGCVIDDSRFTFEPCSGGISGIRLQWVNENEARNALLNADIQLRYNSVTSQ